MAYQKLCRSREGCGAGPYARLKSAMDYWCALWFWPINRADLLPTRAQFLSEMDLILNGPVDAFGGRRAADLPGPRPRLELVRQIAGENRFLHWELEFADLFEDRGGFDLVLGNPPWVKLTWEEKEVLSDSQPLFAVRNLTAAQTTQQRDAALADADTRRMYFKEYESIAAQQNYINAVQNYPALRGLQGNLYE